MNRHGIPGAHTRAVHHAHNVAQHASKNAMAVAKHAAQQGTKIARRGATGRKARNFPRGAVDRAAGYAALTTKQKKVLAQQFKKVRAELGRLHFDPGPYIALNDELGFSQVLFPANWTGPDGIARVVIRCNTELPGTHRRVGCYIRTPTKLVPLDLSKTTLGNGCVRGRVYMFWPNIKFSADEQYAVLLAQSVGTSNGDLQGHPMFSNIGKYRSQLFFIAHGSVGTFVDARQQHLLIVRPNRFETKGKFCFWAGRSSVKTAEGHLQLEVPTPFSGEKSSSRKYVVPPAAKQSEIAVIRCGAQDDQGDPLGIVDTTVRQQFGITRINGQLTFFARPNQRDSKNRLLFAMPATRTEKKKFWAKLANRNQIKDFWCEVPYDDAGNRHVRRLKANHIDSRGRHWFVVYVNSRDPRDKLPIVLMPVDAPGLERKPPADLKPTPAWRQTTPTSLSKLQRLQPHMPPKPRTR